VVLTLLLNITARYTMVASTKESYMEYTVDWLIINMHVVDRLITSRHHVLDIDIAYSYADTI